MTASFQVGPLRLTVEHHGGEWRLIRTFDGDDTVVRVEVPAPERALEAGAVISRHGTSHSDDRLSLTPVLPDRPVVTRPEHPVSVPPRDAATIYVGSPLWVRVAHRSPPITLEDLPCMAPLTTWWGPDTTTGELCYATRTFGRLDERQIVFHPHRVITAVRIENRADAPLLFERLYLPVGQLSVLADEEHRLWTEDVTLEHVAGEEAELTLGDARDGFQRLTGPRNAAPHRLFRAFGSLFR